MNSAHWISQENDKTGKILQDILKKHEAMFKDYLASRLPSDRNVGHEIVIEQDGKPSHRPLLKISREEFKEAKKYADSLLKMKKIRPIPYLGLHMVLHYYSWKKIMDI